MDPFKIKYPKYPDSRPLSDSDKNILADLAGEGERFDDCEHEEASWEEFPGQPRRYTCDDCGFDLTDTLRD